MPNQTKDLLQEKAMTKKLSKFYLKIKNKKTGSQKVLK